MEDLDSRLEGAQPAPVRESSATGREARALAASIADVRPRRRWRRQFTAALCGVFVLAGGATAVAAPALFDWSWGSADTFSVQEFPVGEDSAGQTCAMALWAEADAGAPAELNQAVGRAQEYLHEQDWSSLDDDATSIWANQRRALIDDGSATPALLASLTAAQVRENLDRAGLIVPGMMISTRVDCGPGAGE